jgi:hypothetical protein
VGVSATRPAPYPCLEIPILQKGKPAVLAPVQNDPGYIDPTVKPTSFRHRLMCLASDIPRVEMSKRRLHLHDLSPRPVPKRKSVRRRALDSARNTAHQTHLNQHALPSSLRPPIIPLCFARPARLRLLRLTSASVARPHGRHSTPYTALYSTAAAQLSLVEDGPRDPAKMPNWALTQSKSPMVSQLHQRKRGNRKQPQQPPINQRLPGPQPQLKTD